jgi:hypothetical protein
VEFHFSQPVPGTTTVRILFIDSDAIPIRILPEPECPVSGKIGGKKAVFTAHADARQPDELLLRRARM